MLKDTKIQFYSDWVFNVKNSINPVMEMKKNVNKT